MHLIVNGVWCFEGGVFLPKCKLNGWSRSPLTLGSLNGARWERLAFGTLCVGKALRWDRCALGTSCVGVGVRWERLLVGDVVGRSGPNSKSKAEVAHSVHWERQRGSGKVPVSNRKRRHTGESRAQSPRVSR